MRCSQRSFDVHMATTMGYQTRSAANSFEIAAFRCLQKDGAATPDALILFSSLDQTCPSSDPASCA
jgi:hypothetical protein